MEIEIKNLSKRYGERRGVFDLSLSINKGEAYGFIGPNGAGKTTAIRHLMGFIRPDSGRCEIRGLDCFKQAREIHADIGYIPGEIALFDGIRGDEYLRFCERLRKKDARLRRLELLERFELEPAVPVRKMSKGMKQKLGLVAAFMHEPDILILDEPTSGLDPLMQQRFVELVREEKARGRTMMISSHSFEEIERTCDRVGILKEGRLMDSRSASQLGREKRRVFSLAFDSKEALAAFMEEGFDCVSQGETRADFAVTGELGGFLQAMARHPVRGLDAQKQGLEEVFLKYYGGESHE